MEWKRRHEWMAGQNKEGRQEKTDVQVAHFLKGGELISKELTPNLQTRVISCKTNHQIT